MNITQFNGPNLNAVRAALKAAVKQVESEFGIVVDLGGRISYDSTSFRMKLSVETKSHADHEAKAFIKPVGGAAIGVGTQFKLRTCTFTVIALKPNRPKYPFVAQNQNGTRYKFSRASIESYLTK